MKTKTLREIGIIIMTLAIILGVYAIIASMDTLYDITILIFLIGIIISDTGVYKLLKAYENEYGDIEE